MKYFLSILGFTVPVVALAQFGSLGDIAGFITGLVNSIVSVLVAFIFVAFLWGMVKIIILPGAGGKDKNKNPRADARRLIQYSLISLFVVLSLWGIMQLMQNTFFGRF